MSPEIVERIFEPYFTTKEKERGTGLGQDVDLVITDMTTPNMTGDRFSRELLGIRGDIPIILCTGFSEKISSDAARSLGVRGFLMKPLLPREVAHLIRSILNGFTIP